MLSLTQCKEDKDVCEEKIQLKIEELRGKPKQNPAAEIWEYTYQGQRVYTISANCCDQYNMVYDECLNPICAPSGGLSGKGDGRCPDFSSAATDGKLVWRDPR
ncbi:hypothetical protein DNI29_03360 [Hymenobacter sediminis]|nr:hypothetical protein DNI29_03360 [Hymenobacter sediminis]